MMRSHILGLLRLALFHRIHNTLARPHRERQNRQGWILISSTDENRRVVDPGGFPVLRRACGHRLLYLASKVFDLAVGGQRSPDSFHWRLVPHMPGSSRKFKPK